MGRFAGDEPFDITFGFDFRPRTQGKNSYYQGDEMKMKAASKGEGNNWSTDLSTAPMTNLFTEPTFTTTEANDLIANAIRVDRKMWLSAIEDTKYDEVLGLDDTTIDHLKASWASVIRSAPLEQGDK